MNYSLTACSLVNVRTKNYKNQTILTRVIMKNVRDFLQGTLSDTAICPSVGPTWPAKHTALSWAQGLLGAQRHTQAKVDPPRFHRATT